MDGRDECLDGVVGSFFRFVIRERERADSGIGETERPLHRTTVEKGVPGPPDNWKLFTVLDDVVATRGNEWSDCASVTHVDVGGCAQM